MKTRVIIKGNREDAEQAAQERGLSFQFENESDRWDETYGIIDTSDADAERTLGEWYTESVKHRGAFVAGTLLHYRWLVG